MPNLRTINAIQTAVTTVTTVYPIFDKYSTRELTLEAKLWWELSVTSYCHYYSDIKPYYLSIAFVFVQGQVKFSNLR